LLGIFPKESEHGGATVLACGAQPLEVSMAEFLTAQLDYVYFAYGLALVLLGAVATAISRSAPDRLPWGWFAAFAYAHGVVEWLYLLELATGNSPALSVVVTVLLLGNYLLLLEFARRSQVVLGGAAPGRWLTWAVGVTPVAVALAWGVANLNPATRVFVALPATLWAAANLARASRPTVPSATGAGGALGWAGLCIAVYGLAAGILIPAAPLVPPGWPTMEAFFAATSVPVQVVRAAAIGGAALGVWAFATSLDTQGRVVRKRWRFFWLAAVTLLVVLGAGWAFTNRLGLQYDQDLAKDAESAAAQVRDHLVMEMESTSDAARTAERVITRFDLVGALLHGGSTRLDDVVDAIAGTGEEHVAYLLDASGTTVAASNRARPDSFLGRSYAGRPYFREAMAGVPGRFVGRGMTSGKAGFYASEPIRDPGGRVVGAAVVKHVLSADSFGPLGTGTSFLVNSDGQVLVAGTDGLQGRPMWPTARPGQGPGDAVPRPLLSAEPSGTRWIRIDGVRHVAVRKSLPALDWSVIAFKKEALRGPNRLLGILITLLLSLVIVASFLILQRQLGTESRLAQKQKEAEGRAREMARRADTDALTGIANRQGFNEVMAREFARARRFHQPLAMVILDLDHFKRVNDRYGHPVGDQVLAGTARMLSTRIRESDFVARWGGEEFAVVASMTDAAGAARLAEKLRALLEVTHLGPVGAMTASFGVAEMRPDDTVESMVRRADESLYQAKTGGRNQVRCAEAWVDMEVVVVAEAQGKAGNGNADKPVYMDTGYGPIDVEHRELSGGLQALVVLVNGGEAAEVRPAMANLIAAVADHFAHEEALMRRRGYPSRARHEEAHLLFVADAKRFQADLERNGVTPGFAQWARSRLPEWFRYHILAHDVALGKFLLSTLDPDRPVAKTAEEVGA
jgi:diguanylate cyclase (GGDEF)-like protein/hemerythrin-like metal-binding protein